MNECIIFIDIIVITPNSNTKLESA